MPRPAVAAASGNGAVGRRRGGEAQNQRAAAGDRDCQRRRGEAADARAQARRRGAYSCTGACDVRTAVPFSTLCLLCCAELLKPGLQARFCMVFGNKN